jgi:rare lipoprotein A
MRPTTLLARGLRAALAAGLWGLVATAAVAAETFEQTGSASWYGAGHHGKKTASGERFDMHKLTAAHPKLPLGSVVEVTNLANDRTVELRVNDRGPYASARILDVSKAAAEQLGFIKAGTAKVRIRVVDKSRGDLRPKLTVEPAIETAEPDAQVPTDSPEAAPEADQAPDAPIYAVHIGVFSVRANAERAADRVLDIGAVAVTEDWSTGRVLHRVSVRGLPDRAAAEAAREAAVQAGFADARVSRAAS